MMPILLKRRYRSRQTGQSAALFTSTDADARRARHDARAARRPCVQRIAVQEPEGVAELVHASVASRHAVRAWLPAIDEPRRRDDGAAPLELRLAEHERQDRHEQVDVGHPQHAASARRATGPCIHESIARDECWRRREVERAGGAPRRRQPRSTSRANSAASRSRTAPTRACVDVPSPIHHSAIGPARRAAASRGSMEVRAWRRPAPPSDSAPTAGCASSRSCPRRRAVETSSVPAVMLDDAVDHREPEAGALLLGREERVEHLRELLLRDADAGVGDLDDDRPGVEPGRTGSRTVSVPPFGIASQALIRMFAKAWRICPKSALIERQRCRRRASRSMSLQRHLVADQEQRLLERGVEVGVGQRQRPFAREPEQVADDRGAALGLALDEPQRADGARLRLLVRRAATRTSRMSSFATVRMPASGLLISWAMEAESRPSDESFSVWISCVCARRGPRCARRPAVRASAAARSRSARAVAERPLHPVERAPERADLVSARSPARARPSSPARHALGGRDQSSTPGGRPAAA